MSVSLGGVPITPVFTAGHGSMDRYGQRLAAHLDLPSLELDIDTASAGLFNIPFLSAACMRGVARDLHIVHALRGLPTLPHLTHHHLARYGPLLGRPYLLTAHDLIRYFDLKGLGVFINAPNLRDRICLHLDYRGFVAATAVIAVSHSTKRDLTRHLGISPGRIFVVYEGLDHDLFRPVQRRLVDPPYVLFVGSEHPRKNLATLLRAFAALKREPRFRDLRLVKVGAAGSCEAPFRVATRELVQELDLGPDILFTEEVPDEDLPAYYGGAACLVLPSRYEGFGFPPLEAMACGCPVVVSTAGALGEIAGEAALRVAPDDVDGLHAAMRALVTEVRLRDGLRERGFARAREFSWERTARETALVYELVSGSYAEDGSASAAARGRVGRR